MANPWDPFDAMKAGETRNFNSFTANQVGDPTKGGMQVVRGSGSPFGMMDMYRVSGYTPEQAAAAVTAGYNAKLTDVNAGLRPAESASTIGLQGAQGGLFGAQARGVDVEASLAPRLADARITQMNAEAEAARALGKERLMSAQIAGEGVYGDPSEERKAASASLNPLVDQKSLLAPRPKRPRTGPIRIDDILGTGIGTSSSIGRAKGETKVPGKGSGTVDSVPRMLAPGEAVINKAAAEHMGRGLIAALNHMGAKKMGLV